MPCACRASFCRVWSYYLLPFPSQAPWNGGLCLGAWVRWANQAQEAMESKGWGMRLKSSLGAEPA